MRAVCLSALLMCSAPAWCVDIVEVLVSSNERRLSTLVDAPADSARAAVVRATWERLRPMVPMALPTLRVVTGPLQAEAVMGTLVVASEALADLSEGERVLMLAHELGHVSLHHWGEQRTLYQRFIPGEVRPDTTDPVAGALGAEAHTQSYRHEFEADAFGYTIARRMGYGTDTALALMGRQAVPIDTATHPGARRRMMQFRELETRLQQPSRQAAATAD
ncbi:hypothetical protein C7444_12516 [Sphaerotilus hippei]|uniref:Peptidase M48-like protein n=1 Tax=Sphaerotilus hippei TaxID=744406 RepID=A0A318GUU2_9BURK|nr:hypothetical protein [Sphaerotilus hippei]PXW92342.1 hypothetical protein C7444_12516 [Sphaerotilus hippei]